MSEHKRTVSYTLGEVGCLASITAIFIVFVLALIAFGKILINFILQ